MNASRTREYERRIKQQERRKKHRKGKAAAKLPPATVHVIDPRGNKKTARFAFEQTGQSFEYRNKNLFSGSYDLNANCNKGTS